MMTVLGIAWLVVSVFIALLVFPWLAVYWPSPDEETKKYIVDLIMRTRLGYAEWKQDPNDPKGYIGLDADRDHMHKFRYLGSSARFLRTYTPIEGKYTFEKTQLADINIQPWYPMWRLDHAIREQINSE